MTFVHVLFQSRIKCSTHKIKTPKIIDKQLFPAFKSSAREARTLDLRIMNPAL